MRHTATDKLLIVLRSGGEYCYEPGSGEAFFDEVLWLPGKPSMHPWGIPSVQLIASAARRGLIDYEWRDTYVHWVLTDSGKARADALIAVLPEESRRWLVAMADKYGLPDLSGEPWA